jgi:hypothetical protein
MSIITDISVTGFRFENNILNGSRLYTANLEWCNMIIVCLYWGDRSNYPFNQLVYGMILASKYIWRLQAWFRNSFRLSNRRVLVIPREELQITF